MCNVAVEDYDIIMFTETYLDENINSNELGLHNYYIFRADRNARTSTCIKQGGVLIAVKKSINCRLLHTPVDTVEHLFVLLIFNGRKVVIGNAYIPPNSPLQKYEEFCSSVSHILSENYVENVDVLLCGDFNRPGVLWINDPEGTRSTGKRSEETDILADCMAFFQCFQLNSIPNCFGNYLDLIFSNRNDFVVEICENPLLRLDNPHPALQFDMKIDSEVLNDIAVDYNYFNFRLCNYKDLLYFYVSLDWNKLFEAQDVNQMIEFFYDNLFEGINMFTPMCRHKGKTFPKWMDMELKNLIFEKKKMHKSYKTTGSLLDYNKFSNLRSLCRDYSQLSYQNYIKNIEQNMNSKRDFWQYVNSKKQNKIIPANMFLEHEESHSPEISVELFRKFFSSIYTNYPNTQKSFENIEFSSNFSTLQISTMDVFHKIEKLDNRLACGPDGIPVVFIKNCKYFLADILCRMFNKSLAGGCFPSMWKLSYVTPVFKDGDRSDIKSYRSISKISLFAKLFESIVADKLTPYFDQIIINQQHGFTKGRSTITNLLTYEETLLEALESGYQVDVIYTDFSKAFDRVDHSIMLKKLERMGFHGYMLGWLESNLCGRRQAIKIENHISSEFAVLSGVPQGGHLSTLLFKAFINDIASVLKSSQFALLADDLKFFRIIRGLLDCQILQQELNQLSEWCDYNNLDLNTNKCKSVTFSRNVNRLHFTYQLENVNLEKPRVIRDLGVFFDAELSFVDHIDIIVNKAMRMLGFLFRTLKDFTNIYALKNAYIAVVRSVLEYACSVWSPYYEVHKNRLERVQKKFLRFICYRLRIPVETVDYSELMKLLNLSSLESRRKYYDLCMLFKIINNEIDSMQLLSSINFHIPSRITRNYNLFSIGQHRTNYGYNSPIDRFSRFANELIDQLDIDFFNISLNRYKATLKNNL